MPGPNDSDFFEGREKKLEITVSSSGRSLRALGETAWAGVVRAARAEVLSRRSNEACDAYLLSESSLFVFERRATLITCGRTRLADAAAALLELVPPSSVERLVFQRPGERVPGHQPTTFDEDAAQLGRLLAGRTLRLGDPPGDCVEVFAACVDDAPAPGDETFEIRMHGIDARRARSFAARPSEGTLAETLGLHAILPGFELDENVFTPAGYSLNAIDRARYYTVHVTPEGVGSYASFATNVDVRPALTELVGRVIAIFGPSSFDVVAFTSGGATRAPEIPGYTVDRRAITRVCGYDVTFWAWVRETAHGAEIPSKLGA